MEPGPAAFHHLEALVRRHFGVQQAWVEDGVPVFAVAAELDLDVRFAALRQDLLPLGALPLLRRSGDRLLLSVVPRAGRIRGNGWVNVALFAATVVTTFLTGYIGSQRFLSVLQQVPDAVIRAGYWPNPLVDGIAFSLGLLGILLVHELGHKAAARAHGIDASWPYFIPFPPVVLGALSIGTMGAVILTKEPAPDRDGLFDLGASGPLAGLVVAIPLLLIGVGRTVVLDLEALRPYLAGLPTFFFPWSVSRLLALRFGDAPDVVFYTDPLTDAAMIGLFVTGINLLPASMLDGGHVVRALLSPRWHRATSYAAVVLLALMGLLPMALLLLVLLSRPHPGPANDVSPPSRSRALIGLLLLVVFVAALPLDNLFLLPRLLLGLLWP
ncbi:MAG: site-2 protease family protein [Armatimonadota bacterium]|nr:site-2 protease family protein [Armatimonadota bacterium]MDR5696686.1 site-2 protease family protein [Armatimonadota bacterium]